MNTGFSRGYSPIVVTAAISVALLIAASGMQLGKTFAKGTPINPAALQPAKMPSYVVIDDADQNGKPDWQDELERSGVKTEVTASSSAETATSSDPLTDIGAALAQSLIGGYLSLKQYDAYTPDRGDQLVKTIADSFRAPATFVPHTVDKLILDSNTSRERTIQYRADMQTALKPLITDEEPELTLFAGYIQTEDRSWLDRLSVAASHYREAEKNLLTVRIPQDAAPEHLRVINATGAYAHTLERMVHFAHDPLANMALLRTYNDSERDFDLAFDALVKYYARKITDK